MTGRLNERFALTTRFSFVFCSVEFSYSMGRKGSKRKRTTKAISKGHFPVGELAKNRKQIRDEYSSKC